MDGKGKISSFKKFSELREKNETEPSQSIPVDDVKGTPIPNIPTDSTKMPKAQDTRYMKPEAQTEKGVDYTTEEGTLDEKKVELIGKIAKLPRGVKAHKGLNFMENIKIPKSSIWYIMVEKQSNELQMLKYNLTKGVDLSRFTNDLKNYYKTKFSKNQNLVKLIEAIDIDGNQTYSWIKNIPLIEIEGKKMISIITEDLIKLLSK